MLNLKKASIHYSKIGFQFSFHSNHFLGCISLWFVNFSCNSNKWFFRVFVFWIFQSRSFFIGRISTIGLQIVRQFQPPFSKPLFLPFLEWLSCFSVLSCQSCSVWILSQIWTQKYNLTVDFLGNWPFTGQWAGLEMKY